MNMVSAGTTDMTLNRHLLGSEGDAGIAVNLFVSHHLRPLSRRSFYSIKSRAKDAPAADSEESGLAEHPYQANWFHGAWSGSGSVFFVNVDFGTTDLPAFTGSALFDLACSRERTPLARLVKWSYEDVDGVNRFLAEFPRVRSVIEAIEPSIASNFGLGTEVVLRVMPAIEEGGHDELVAWILSDEEIETGLARLDVLAEEWDERIWESTRGRLCVNIAFP